MTDLNEKMGKAVQDFLAEAEEIVDQINLELVSLSDFSEIGDYNPDLVNSIFRGAHSLKGLAGMFGFSLVADLSHNLENLLDSLRLGKIPLVAESVSILFESVELLGNLVRNAGTDQPDEQLVTKVVTRINSHLAGSSRSESFSPLDVINLPDKVLSTLTEYEEHRLMENAKKGRNILSIRASFSLSSFDQDLVRLTEILKKRGEVISTLPSTGEGLEFTIDFEILFGTETALPEVREMLGDWGSGLVITCLNSTEQQPAADVPDEPPATAPEPSLTAKSASRTVRVDIAKLDELMNIVGELVLCHSSIFGLSLQMKRDGYTTPALDLAKGAKELKRKLNDLQKGVLDIRMIPVGQLFEKMSRIVRKISRDQGKKVELKMFGADTELDKLIIEDISDPMMHIIRNAIDHGIEMPEERLLQAKQEKGTITLSSFQKGNHVIIEIVDDGRGIELEKVKRKALEKGLISDSERITDSEAIELLFLPGFSTSDHVSEISGRGVGMDVVRNNIASVSGMVDIETSPGAGCRVTITLPITLAIIKALIISAAGRTYAISITSVLETIMMENKDILTVERKEVVQLREATLPLIRLGRFFNIEDASVRPENFYVVVVGIAEKRLGIVVNDLLGQQDIVIKSMGESFKGFKGISGAADLGDQRTILVLDVGGIIQEATRGS